MNPRNRRFFLALAILSLALAARVGTALAAPGAPDPAIAKQLAAVRQATAKYHDPTAALTDGYVATDACATSPVGGMGLHYPNPARMGRLDILRPDILLYEPTTNGPKLVGVEYFLPALARLADGTVTPWFDHAPPPAGAAFLPGPALFGQRFDGPMPGHEAGMPWHYDLHVWLWEANPAGLFAPWNPTVHCPH
jgi:hypothetical protein